MAKFSNTKKPAFFIPFMDYKQSIGGVDYQDNLLNDIHLLNPTKTHKIEMSSITDFQYDISISNSVVYNSISDSDGYVYLFILGHNFHTRDCSMEVQLYNPDSDSYISYESRDNVVNDNSDWSSPNYNGFSIIKLKYSIDVFKGFRIIIRGFSSDSDGILKLGCVSLCSKWTPPHSPDLKLTMSREYDGVNTLETKGGATLSNSQYTRGGTFWASSYAWELTGSDYEYDSNVISSQRTLGRRNWGLKFSYINDSDLMPEFESLTNYSTEFNYSQDKNIQQSKSFFARVLNRVQSSHIPFIFLPNDTDPNYNPDNWAITRFNQESFNIKQVANSVYDISLKIREVW